ncbi:MAG TPA: GAF domain-containing sensor histidine kinase [Bacillales bacterium]|nr:GAF domain-containing sensor histidine kinase [Bacillales bacterium]
MAKTFENNDLLTLKVIAETLNRSNDLHEMLQTVLEKLLEVTGLPTGWIFLAGQKPDYELIASHHLPPALSRENNKPMCGGVCYCLNQYWNGELNKPVNIIECKRLEDAKKYEWGDRGGLKHHATVPLAAGNDWFGILNVAAPQKEHFSEAELNLLQAVSYQIGTALKRIRLARKQQEAALDEERNRLSRDLHDSVNQKLFSLALTARGARAVHEDKQVLSESLQQIEKLAHDAQKEMRSLIWQLRPAGVEEGVITALRKYGSYLGLKVKDQVQGVQDLPRSIEETLWRIGQEALNNVKKHSGTDRVKINLKISSNQVMLSIVDEGNGCDLNRVQEGRSYGITSMKERASLYGGKFVIRSQNGKGTRVTVSFPLEGGRKVGD